MYQECVKYVIAQLSRASTIAITTDGWTSRATQGYETYTVHVIDDELIMQSKDHLIFLKKKFPFRLFSQNQTFKHLRCTYHFFFTAAFLPGVLRFLFLYHSFFAFFLIAQTSVVFIFFNFLTFGMVLWYRQVCFFIPYCLVFFSSCFPFIFSPLNN